MRTTLACGLLLATLPTLSVADEFRIGSEDLTIQQTRPSATDVIATHAGSEAVTEVHHCEDLPNASQLFSTEPIVPAVRGIEEPQRLERGHSTGTENRKLSGQPAFTAVFNSPAHFGVHEHSRYGRVATTRPVVIYEGMTLKVDPGTGEFEVRFLAEVPRTTVVMNMQFRIEGLDGPSTVTLPPLVFGADRRHDLKHASPTSNTWQVRRTGTSDVLKRAARGGLEKFAVSRHGTVQVGEHSAANSLY